MASIRQRIPALNREELCSGPQNFDFQFRFFDAEGVRNVRLDSFTEKIGNLPGKLKITGDDVEIELPVTRAKFVGVINSEKTVIEGKWLQSGKEFPLSIAKVPLEETRDIELKRPQTPQPPFPYNSDEVSIVPSELNNQKYEADVKLAATLTTPKTAGPHPAVVLISGSGPQDRDETIFGHKPFAIIADHLTRRGIAVLRFDERGVAKSVGNFAKATTEDFANDVEAIMDWLIKNPKIDGTKIGLIGHSEGGLIAPMIAARRNDVAAIVMLAGPGVPGKAIVMNQSRLIAKASGANEAMLQFQDELVREVLAQMKKPEGLTEAFVNEFAEQVNQNLPEGLTSEEVTPMVKQAVSRFDNPWMEFFLEYDPAPALRKTKCPVLAVVGEKDLQVDPELNMPVIERELKAGGNANTLLKRFPNLNHLFQNCKLGTPSEYNQIEESFDTAALDYIGNWLEVILK